LYFSSTKQVEEAIDCDYPFEDFLTF